MTVPSSSTSIENKGAKRIQPKTECEKDVLLLRRNSDLPQMKEGDRYRVRAGGSAHANSGEGYAIYVYGKGRGLRVLADGKQVAAADSLSRLTGKL